MGIDRTYTSWAASQDERRFVCLILVYKLGTCPLFFFCPIHGVFLPNSPHCFSHAAENDTHDGKRKCETLWPIFKIAHQKSRYVYDLYYRRKEISKELFEFCLDQGYADRNLISKWKKVCFPSHRKVIFVIFLFSIFFSLCSIPRTVIPVSLFW